MDPVFEFGDFQLDVANKTLLRNGITVGLTPKVFDTLRLLVERNGQLVEKEEFVQKLWPGTFVEDAALAENISRLRRALGEKEGQPWIVTVPKRGYRFGGEVRKAAASDAVNPPVHPKVPRTSKLRLTFGLLAVALLLVLGGGYLYLRQSNLFASLPVHSLAVLPLENLSGDPEQEYFADGMTDDLITQLAKISSLRVISRTSVMRLKGTRKSLSEIARELNVDAVVEGTVTRSPERVRVTAQVVRANPEQHLWAESYDRPLGDVVLLQGELAKEISRAIRIQLTPQEQTRLASTRPVNPGAYEACLKGRYFWSKRTDGTTKKAIEYFQQAIEKEPTYALAYAGLSDSYASPPMSEAMQESVPPAEAFPKAKAAAIRALELDDTLAEAHASLARIKFVYDRDWVGSEAEFKRALELNPNYANAHHWYALNLLWMGRPDEAVDEANRARNLDPLSLIINANLGFILGVVHHDDSGIKQIRKTLDMDPNFSLAHYRLGQIMILKGMNKEAIPELEKAVALSGGSPRATAELGLAYAQLGNKKQALKLLDDLKQRSKQRYVSPFNLAVIYGAVGDKNQALEWLEKAHEQRSPSLVLLNLSPAFRSLRSEPRFVELVRRTGLPAKEM
jgi:TolB-like protein/DNA-binding winged helix-turn-helix (wHTH) protein/tetratricopeptide (TPR) repeat protein